MIWIGPEEALQVYPNLMFDGQCEAAFNLYEKCFRGKITFMMTFEDAPGHMQAPPDWRKKISHATFSHADFMLSGSDAQPGVYQKPQGFALQLNLSDPAEAERIFNTLAENGAVQMALQETFWALRFGVLTDQFGIPWLINGESGRAGGAQAS
jgi:PhnB protein